MQTIYGLILEPSGVAGIDFGASSVKVSVRTGGGIENMGPNGIKNIASDLSINSSGVIPGSSKGKCVLSQVKERLSKIRSSSINCNDDDM